MVNTLADVTITATATALSATSIRANWVQIQGKTITAAARVGDSLISSTRGAMIPSANSILLFPSVGNTNCYDLSTIYIIGTANDVAAVCYNTV